MERWIICIPIVLMAIAVGVLYGRVKSLEHLVVSLFELAKILKTQHDECDKMVEASQEIVKNMSESHEIIMEQYNMIMSEYKSVSVKIGVIDALMGNK